MNIPEAFAGFEGSIQQRMAASAMKDMSKSTQMHTSIKRFTWMQKLSDFQGLINACLRVPPPPKVASRLSGSYHKQQHTPLLSSRLDVMPLQHIGNSKLKSEDKHAYRSIVSIVKPTTPNQREKMDEQIDPFYPKGCNVKVEAASTLSQQTLENKSWVDPQATKRLKVFTSSLIVPKGDGGSIDCESDWHRSNSALGVAYLKSLKFDATKENIEHPSWERPYQEDLHSDDAQQNEFATSSSVPCLDAARTVPASIQAISSPPSTLTERRLLHPSLFNSDTQKSSKSNENALSMTVNDAKWAQKFHWNDILESTNVQVFGNKSFREQQKNAINAALSGEDVFLVMPTGGGKSLCYQLPAVIKQSAVTIVVMPLLSLMQDQLEQLTITGINARSIIGTDSLEKQRQMYKDLCDPSIDVKILFVTPEKLSGSARLLSVLHQLNHSSRLASFVIDEAHCVSQWGNEFRGDFLKLKNLRKEFPNVPLMCMTATATDTIISDVISQLGMRQPQVFKLSLNRQNLRYLVRAKVKKSFVSDMLKVIKAKYLTNSGIIYCLSRAECEEIAAELISGGISAGIYHSTADNKEMNQRKWMNDEIQVMVATVAFGMGINKKDVRFVFHSSMPKSLENYYQESGRAGRDGKESLCIIFYDYQDKIRLQKLVFLTDSDCKTGLSQETKDINEKNILSMVKYCEEPLQCRRKLILQHFGEPFDGHCLEECDNCFTRRVEPNATKLRPATVEISWVLDFVKRVKAEIPNARSLTFATLRDALMGRKKTSKLQQSSIDFSQIPSFGCLRNAGWSVDDASALLRQMIVHGLLREKVAPLPSFPSTLTTCLSLGPYGDIPHQVKLTHVVTKHNVASTTLSDLLGTKESTEFKTYNRSKSRPQNELEKKVKADEKRHLKATKQSYLIEPSDSHFHMSELDLVQPVQVDRAYLRPIESDDELISTHFTNLAYDMELLDSDVEFANIEAAKAFEGQNKKFSRRTMNLKGLDVTADESISPEDKVNSRISHNMILTPEGQKELTKVLTNLRKSISVTKGLSNVAHIISTDGIKQIVEQLPLTTVELKELGITGMTAAKKIEEYGTLFVDAVAQFVLDFPQFVTLKPK